MDDDDDRAFSNKLITASGFSPQSIKLEIFTTNWNHRTGSKRKKKKRNPYWIRVLIHLCAPVAIWCICYIYSFTHRFLRMGHRQRHTVDNAHIHNLNDWADPTEKNILSDTIEWNDRDTLLIKTVDVWVWLCACEWLGHIRETWWIERLVWCYICMCAIVFVSENVHGVRWPIHLHVLCTQRRSSVWYIPDIEFPRFLSVFLLSFFRCSSF